MLASLSNQEHYWRILYYFRHHFSQSHIFVSLHLLLQLWCLSDRVWERFAIPATAASGLTGMCWTKTSVFSEGAQAQTPQGLPVTPPNHSCHLPSDLRKVSKSHCLLAFLQNTQKPLNPRPCFLHSIPNSISLSFAPDGHLQKESCFQAFPSTAFGEEKRLTFSYYHFQWSANWFLGAALLIAICYQSLLGHLRNPECWTAPWFNYLFCATLSQAQAEATALFPLATHKKSLISFFSACSSTPALVSISPEDLRQPEQFVSDTNLHTGCVLHGFLPSHREVLSNWHKICQPAPPPCEITWKQMCAVSQSPAVRDAGGCWGSQLEKWFRGKKPMGRCLLALSFPSPQSTRSLVFPPYLTRTEITAQLCRERQGINSSENAEIIIQNCRLFCDISIFSKSSLLRTYLLIIIIERKYEEWGK